MKRNMQIGALLACLMSVAECGPSFVVPIGTGSSLPTSNSALEVLTRNSVVEPLPLRGSRVAYSGLYAALSQGVSRAAEPWVTRHIGRTPPGDGWQLLITPTQADAAYHHGQATVTMAVRATLRTRVGNQHISQAQAHCQQTLQVTAEEAERVFQACIQDLSAELSRWLSGIEP